MMKQDQRSGAELVNPYHEGSDKGAQVEEMFDSIASAYDFMNTAMTFGLHRWWRNRALSAAVKELGATEVSQVLDIATGTGDVAFELHRRYPQAEVLGVDLSNGMLDVARAKLAKLPEATRRAIRFEQGDSLALDINANSQDLITVAYGVRNFERLSQGLAEMYRVLKPGGVLCIIELSQPESGATRFMYNIYSRSVIPTIGRLVSGDSRAYTYLPESIAAAPQRAAMTAIMSRCGFKQCRWRSLTFGAVTYYIARK